MARRSGWLPESDDAGLQYNRAVVRCQWCSGDNARATKTTVMANPFSSDEASESSGTREDFIGRVVHSAVDHEFENNTSEYESDIDVLYEIEVLNQDYDNLSELGVNVRKSLGSKWMLLIGSLENIHGPDAVREFTTLDDLCEFLEGKVYEFTDMDLTADEEFEFEHKGGGEVLNLKETFGDLENPPNPMLLPVREVTDPEELADLGVESEAATEEVDF